MSNKPLQKILFGSPGTGKSHRIMNNIIPNDLKISNISNVIKTVFHPEYTYGDFVGKLVPHSKGGRVEYRFFAGHFLFALAQAYKNIIDSVDKEGNLVKEPDNVVLVIDEINRGNSAAIFGTVFQLLDRDPETGWSSYFINITELELITILELIGVKIEVEDINTRKGVIYEYKFPTTDHFVKDYITFQGRVDCLRIDLKQKRIFVPPNLSLLASMNTSDNSIYFMDNAFKRRWDWQFVDIKEDEKVEALQSRYVTIDGLEEPIKWISFVNRLNDFFIDNHKVIRKIEDKQIGYFFINEGEINIDHIKSKLMFFVWDSVFHTDKKPLAKLLGITNEKELVTFGQFTQSENVLKFLQNIYNR